MSDFRVFKFLTRKGMEFHKYVSSCTIHTCDCFYFTLHINIVSIPMGK